MGRGWGMVWLRSVAAVTVLLTVGCAPWASASGRSALPRAEWEVGVGLAWMAPVSPRIWSGLPVPQIWAGRGLGRSAELRISWAPPVTLEARARLDVLDRSGSVLAVHAGGGWLSFGGAFGLPTGGVPFLRGGATLVRSAEGAGEAYFGSLELTAPFRTSDVDRTAWTLWGSAVVGIETTAGGWRVAPQLGALLSFARPDRPLWFPAISLAREP